ncbi:MAG: hypothetical protein IT342_11625 [Candidatus Melainabacteria bacterium]|nr:hypothetical protein [Candidatus Melainabacteria bacterium]
MSSIPTKAEVAKNAADTASAAAAAREKEAVKTFTDAIVAAMNAGQTSYSHRTANVSPAVLKLLQEEFGKSGWTLSVRNARTGCTITWE